MRTFHNERSKITVEIENNTVTAYKDSSNRIIYPGGKRTLFQKRLDELRGVPKDETGYIEHLKANGYVEV